MTVGIEDRSVDTSRRITVQVFIDEELVANVVATFGKPTAVDADITGATVLRIQWRQELADACGGDDYLAFGTPQLLR
jgi:hypothetical protein